MHETTDPSALTEFTLFSNLMIIYLLVLQVQEILKKVSGALTSTAEGVRPGKSDADRNKYVQKVQSGSISSPVGRLTEILDDHPKVRPV